MSKSYVAARPFNVAGTEKQFAEGDPVTGTRAELDNYEAAGLIVAAAVEAKPAPAPTPTPAPARKPRARKRA